MKKALNVFLALSFIFLYGFFTVHKEVNNFGYSGTIIVVTIYDEGLVFAADGKATFRERKSGEQVEAVKVDKRLLYQQKLFKIGKNLVVAYGGRAIVKNELNIPAAVINRNFLHKHKIKINDNLQFTDISSKLFHFLKNQFYSQRDEHQTHYIYAVLAGFNKNEPTIHITWVNWPNNPFLSSHKTMTALHGNRYEPLVIGPYQKDVITKRKDISEKFDSVFKKMKKKELLNKDEALYFTVTNIKECIKIESSKKDKINMAIDFPIHYCTIEKNKPIEIKKVLN